MVVLLYNVVLLYGYINPIICGGTTRHKGTPTQVIVCGHQCEMCGVWEGGSKP